MDKNIAEKLEDFFTQYKHQTYKKNQILIRADDSPSGIFYLKNGMVKEYLISNNGDEVVVNIFKPISFFPMSWAINSTPNNYFFEAMTDLEVWKAPKEEIVSFIKNNPDVLYDLISRLYKGMDGLLQRMTYLMSGLAQGRLILELLIYAKRFGNDKIPVIVDISEKDLAAQSGLTRETVNREMKKLKDHGYVSVKQNTIVILNIQKLEEQLIHGV